LRSTTRAASPEHISMIAYIILRSIFLTTLKGFPRLDLDIFMKLVKLHKTISSKATLIPLVMESSEWARKKNCHYKKTWFFKRPIWSKCPHWPKDMSILTKGLGHEKHMLHLTKVTFLTKCQVENMVKMDKCPSKWPWLSQIGHIKWIGFNQIDHYDLTLTQMNHTHLMILLVKLKLLT
jgi:hypothetical protein